MRVLFLSNLFPDADRPVFGVHNASVVQRLATRCDVSVIALRPQLSAFFRWPGSTSGTARSGDEELSPTFPVVPYVPRVGTLVNHRLYATWLAPSFRNVCAIQPPDVLLAAWAYPDACAALRLARTHDLPGVVIVQGTDINDYLTYPLRRRIILTHLAEASMVVTRSEALRGVLLAAGLPPAKVTTIYNGVDTDLFSPARDRVALRQELGIAPGDRVVLFVGNLVPVKNPSLAVEAVAALNALGDTRHWRLLVVGDGPLRSGLEATARGGLGDAVTFLGTRPQDDVCRFMQAADILCVPSRNEGVPNVIREALACGLPVAARRVGGVPELLTSASLGELVSENTVEAMALALQRIDQRSPMAESCRHHAMSLSWDHAITQYCNVLHQAVPPPRGGTPGKS
ncbi:MAG: glycosyltransferase [Lentisphaerae bacterium]|nr:glycosyltransferase [Lentisphaerota bacterium]MBT5607038.1 glycosyltransferase [Lentisphaerota bacterium]MBT7055792.1 glycosyltransferase [Lentisphaerota bacterium]